MDELLSRELARERELFEDDSATYGPDYINEICEETYEMEGETFYFSAARFRRQMRQSNLVTVCTFWESRMADITRMLLAEANARRGGVDEGLSLHHFRGNNVCQRSRIALTRYVGLSDDKALWNGLKDFSVLRNKIIHEGGGSLADEKNGEIVFHDQNLKTVYQKLKSKGLSLVEHGDLAIDPNLIELFIERVQEYICDVLDKAAELFDTPKPVK